MVSTPNFTVTLKGGYYRKTKGNERILRRNLEKYGDQLAKELQAHAKDIAPHISGDTKNFILIEKKKDK